MLDPVREFLPNYETGKAVGWRTDMASGEPLAIAGLWRAWEEPEGPPSLSFTMLTVNADEHPLMKRFHKPGDEKRSVVIVPPDAYEDRPCRTPTGTKCTAATDALIHALRKNAECEHRPSERAAPLRPPN
jgi:hypothetical protein